MKVVFSGLEGSGKSLQLARTARDLVKRNAKWFLESGKQRGLASNLKFSQAFEEWASSLHVPITYWENLDELIKMKDVDVICDELGNYFDSRMWQDLSLAVRRWLTQGSKSGIELYGSAQDFAQIDKSFRRLVNRLIEIRKTLGSRRPSATKPPVKRIWGLCLGYGINPRSYKEDDKEFESNFFPTTLFFIRKKDCDIFDTRQEIFRGRLPALRHEVRYCQHHTISGGDGSCDFCKQTHI